MVVEKGQCDDVLLEVGGVSPVSIRLGWIWLVGEVSRRPVAADLLVPVYAWNRLAEGKLAMRMLLDMFVCICHCSLR